MSAFKSAIKPGDTKPEIVLPVTWAECVALARAEYDKPVEPETSEIPAAIPPDTIADWMHRR